LLQVNNGTGSAPSRENATYFDFLFKNIKKLKKNRTIKKKQAFVLEVITMTTISKK